MNHQAIYSPDSKNGRTQKCDPGESTGLKFATYTLNDLKIYFNNQRVIFIKRWYGFCFYTHTTDD
jgi:hypothetical protein